MNWQRILIPIFSRVWRHRLHKDKREVVVMVRGWRSALVDDKWGGRKHVTFLFWWFK
jgi:hypothetical protein